MARKADRSRRRRQWGGWAGWEPREPWWLREDYGHERFLGYYPVPYDWEWVMEGLATGGMPTTEAEVDYLARQGITHVVNCADELAAKADAVLTDPRITYLRNPEPDDGKWKEPRWFAETISFAVPAILAGGKVLVHCVMGSNRGPSNAYAVARALGLDPVRAEAAVRLARPKASLLYLPDANAALKEIA